MKAADSPRRMHRMGPNVVKIRTAGFLLALLGFVLAVFLSASPSLHEAAHSDAHESEHHCLATDLHSGACDSSTVAAPVMHFTGHPVEVVLESPSHLALSLFLSCRILEHAPPVGS